MPEPTSRFGSNNALSSHVDGVKAVSVYIRGTTGMRMVRYRILRGRDVFRSSQPQKVVLSQERHQLVMNDSLSMENTSGDALQALGLLLPMVINDVFFPLPEAVIVLSNSMFG